MLLWPGLVLRQLFALVVQSLVEGPCCFTDLLPRLTGASPIFACTSRDLKVKWFTLSDDCL